MRVRVPIPVFAAALCLLFFAITASVNLTKHWSFASSLHDIGRFSQVFWKLSHGQVPTTAILGDGLRNHFGFHFSPLFVLLAPLYRLFPFPEALLILNSAAVAFTGWLLFRFIRKDGLYDGFALFCGGMFFLNPFVQNAAIFDFHECVLALPLLVSAYIAARRGRRVSFVVFCLVLLLCKEHYGPAVVGFSWIYWRSTAERSLFFAMGTLGVLYPLVVIFLVMPALYGGTHTALTLTGGTNGHFSWLYNPWQYLANGGSFHGATVVFYLLLLGLPFCLPIHVFAPLLGVIPDLLVNLCSYNKMLRSPFAFYSVGIVAFLMLALGESYARSSWRPPRLRLRVALASAALFLLFPALPRLPNSVWALKSYEFGRSAVMKRLQEDLSPDVSVTTVAALGSHLGHRENLVGFSDRLPTSDVLVLLTRNPFVEERRGVFGLPFGMPQEEYARAALRVLAVKGGYGLLWYSDSVALLKNGVQDRQPRQGLVDDLMLLARGERK